MSADRVDQEAITIVVVASCGTAASLAEITARRRTNPMALILAIVDGGHDARTAALAAGADDAVPRAVDDHELAARSRALQRRRRRPPPTDTAVVGRAVLDRSAWTLRLGDRFLEARPKELLLLDELVAGRGVPVTRERLRERLWGDPLNAPESNALDVHVSRLRRLLRDAGAQIVTESDGYRLLG